MPFPTPPPVTNLDQTSLIELGFSKIEQLSAGLSTGPLNDRSVVGALYWMIAASAAQIAVYGDAINQIPTNVIQQWLTMSGVRRIAQQRCIVPVTIALTERFAETKLIPVGFKASVGSIQFELTQDVEIPPGVASTEGVEVFMQSIEAGSANNISAGSSWTIVTGLSFVASISNGEPVQLGRELESEDDLIDRSIRAIRGRQLVNGDDFEQAAIEFLGEEATALCIPKLAQDKITPELGAVHLFVLSPGGSVPDTLTLNNLAVEMSKRAILQTVYTSALQITNVRVNVIADLSPGYNAETVADSINEQMNDYLRPGNLPPGQSILGNEMIFQCRLVAGIARVVSVSFVDADNVIRRTDLQLQTDFSVAKMTNLSVTLVRTGLAAYVKEYTA